MQRTFSDVPVGVNYTLAATRNRVTSKATLGLPVNEVSFQILQRIFANVSQQQPPQACLMVECLDGLMPVSEVVLTSTGIFFYEPANETGHRRVTIKVSGELVNIRIETDPVEGGACPIEFADRRQPQPMAALP